jgi:glycerol-3-phosphate dehydrogenase (NAD(P)+)
MPETIAILGAGSWGSALAIHLSRVGHSVHLWARDPDLVREMVERRANLRYLPEVPLPERVTPVARYQAALHDAKIVVFAVPSHGLRAVARAAAPSIAPTAVLVSATKGLETDTLRRMSQVLQEEADSARAVVVLSGPSFAAEVARALPTAVLSASRDPEAAAYVQDRFRGPAFRLYVSDDVAGVEIGGAMKNVIAIAAGVVEGLGLGHNSMAALITRGLAEISRLADAEGGRRETLAGLSGLGDLVLTSTGNLSRNRYVGLELGRGRSLEEILGGMRMIAEGVRTTGAAMALGARHGIELPITAEMAAVLEHRRSPAEAVDVLMGRKQRAEADR